MSALGLGARRTNNVRVHNNNTLNHTSVQHVRRTSLFRPTRTRFLVLCHAAPPTHCWRALGVPVGASLAEAKQAYRTRAKTMHPDYVVAKGRKQKASEICVETATKEYVAMKDAYEQICKYYELGGDGEEHAVDESELRRRAFEEAMQKARVAAQVSGLGARDKSNVRASADDDDDNGGGESGDAATASTSAAVVSQLSALKQRRAGGQKRRRRRSLDCSIDESANNVDNDEDDVWFHGVQ